VSTKCKKAAGHGFGGPLWLLLRNAMIADVAPSLATHIAEVPGIAIFAEVWVLHMPVHVLDGLRPPAVRLLYLRTR
jgi:hypothetical protein